jgi:hypothetical protein
MDKWRLNNWNACFTLDTLPMSKEEIQKATKFLRKNNYPKPEDCPEENCPNYRPACKLGICQIAVGMCGDF